MRQFKTGATRDTDEGKLDWEGFISPTAMLLFAQYMNRHRVQTDGSLRDSSNWQKGMPKRQYMKSMVRHMWDLWRKWREEPSDETGMIDLLCAVMFNVQGMLFEITMGRDVQDV